jgi:hypothetical protein
MSMSQSLTKSDIKSYILITAAKSVVGIGIPSRENRA